MLKIHCFRQSNVLLFFISHSYIKVKVIQIEIKEIFTIALHFSNDFPCFQ